MLIFSIRAEGIDVRLALQALRDVGQLWWSLLAQRDPMHITNDRFLAGTMWMREDVMPAIRDELDMAADGECPQCAHLRDI